MPFLRADDAADKNFTVALTGKWIREQPGEGGRSLKTVREFVADRKLKGFATVMEDGKTSRVYAEGTWSVAGGKLSTVVRGAPSTETITEVTCEKLVLTNSAGEESTFQRVKAGAKDPFVPSVQVWSNFFEGHQHILLVCEFKEELRKLECGGEELQSESTIIKAFKGPGTLGQRIRHSIYSGDGFGHRQFVPGTLHFIFVDGDLADPLTVETGGGISFSKEGIESAEDYVRRFGVHPNAKESSQKK